MQRTRISWARNLRCTRSGPSAAAAAAAVAPPSIGALDRDPQHPGGASQPPAPPPAPCLEGGQEGGLWSPPEGRRGVYDAEGRLVLKSLTLAELEAWFAAEGEPAPTNRALQLWRWMYADPPAAAGPGADAGWVRRLEDTAGRQNCFSAKFLEQYGSLLLAASARTCFEDRLHHLEYGAVDAPGHVAQHRQRVEQRAQLAGGVRLRGAAEDLYGRGERTPLTNLVFMGMGEPLHNTEAVLAATQITISTVGLVPEMREVVARTRVQVALSLHATTDEVRDWIVPVNRRYDLATLKAALEELFPLEVARGAQRGAREERQGRAQGAQEAGRAEEEEEAEGAALLASAGGSASGSASGSGSGSASTSAPLATAAAAAHPQLPQHPHRQEEQPQQHQSRGQHQLDEQLVPQPPHTPPSPSPSPSPSTLGSVPQSEARASYEQGRGREEGEQQEPAASSSSASEQQGWWLPPLGPLEASTASAAAAATSTAAAGSTSTSSFGGGGDGGGVVSAAGTSGPAARPSRSIAPSSAPTPASGPGSGRSLLIEYTMLHGINDTAEDARSPDVCAAAGGTLPSAPLEESDDEMAACGQLGNVGLDFRPSPILEPPERFRPFLLQPQ
ncbi:Dual-specificity RNA methyltransferase RlmN [Tetrabaena socialis]|uniref:Dual-specificity RNA methyltransferase RlmN n=1 Tax=Tetrabaena socialis TaxID=47790 RepID=A0A2J8A9S7_9CHLO|nr:Dual-specificity RNA methyltransferase RlmN [Tetrabaena socialis]|eukprot:PNH09276.1 Dual-specificity RNA methyltransferase RlmN [Tetrabaena socialis]